MRIGITDSLAQPRIALLLARSREEETRVGHPASLSCRSRSSSKACTTTCSDIGFALSDGVNDGLVAEPASDPLSVIVPARHPLFAHVQAKLQDALKFPLVLCRPDAGSGCHSQIQVLDGAASNTQGSRPRDEPGRDVDAGGRRLWHWFRDRFAGADLAAPGHRNRPLAGTAPTLTTFLLRRQGEPSEPMKRFISRVKAIGGAPGGETGA